MKKDKIKKYVVCKLCGLNPNDTQTKEQIEWELDFINQNKGVCSACIDEEI